VLVLSRRGHRIELHRDELSVRLPLRTRHIAYRDITAVRGDVPTRLEWSTWLVVERRRGRRVTLPPVDLPIVAVHDLLAERVAAARGSAR
jgi:hypothetical protein